MALLRIQTGARSGTLLPIDSSNFTIGRGEKVSLRLSDQGSSRQHAELFRIGELYFVRDLSSRNGTFVNDRRITEVVLREGDQIRIGDTVLLFLETETSAKARSLRVEEGKVGGESIRFRDTIVGALPQPAKGQSRKEGLKGLTRRVSQILAEETGLKQVLERVIRELGQALGGDRADILILESAEPEARFRSAAAFDTKGDGEVAISRTILMEVLEGQQSILSSDASTDQRFGESDSIISHAIRSVICVPMLAAGRAVGAIYLSNSQRSEAFDREDLEAAGHVGLQLSALLGMLKVFEAREEILRNSLVLAARAFEDPQVADGAEKARAIAGYGRAIAHALGLPPDEVSRAWVAGLLHDLARAKGGGERALRDLLARNGAARLEGMEQIVEAIECQDERHNGSGSPRHRVGDEIPLLGRILSLAKEVDRLGRSGGPDGRGLPMEEALASIRETAGEAFHPDVIQACLVAERNGILRGAGRELYLGI